MTQVFFFPSDNRRTHSAEVRGGEEFGTSSKTLRPEVRSCRNVILIEQIRYLTAILIKSYHATKHLPILKRQAT